MIIAQNNNKLFSNQKQFSVKRLEERDNSLYLCHGDIYKDHYPYKDENDKLHVTKKQFSSIITEFAKLSVENLINKGSSKLPYNLGILRLRRFKSKTNSYNWAKYRETKVLERYENNHSDGWIVKCYWEDKPYFNNNFLFKFRLTRRAGKKLAKIIKNDSSVVYRYDVKESIEVQKMKNDIKKERKMKKNIRLIKENGQELINPKYQKYDEKS